MREAMSVYGYSRKEITVNVQVNHGFVLRLPLFIIVRKTLSRVLRSGVTWEDIDADHLASLLNRWRNMSGGIEIDIEKAMEKIGLRVNASAPPVK